MGIGGIITGGFHGGVGNLITGGYSSAGITPPTDPLLLCMNGSVTTRFRMRSTILSRFEFNSTIRSVIDMDSAIRPCTE